MQALFFYRRKSIIPREEEDKTIEKLQTAFLILHESTDNIQNLRETLQIIHF